MTRQTHNLILTIMLERKENVNLKHAITYLGGKIKWVIQYTSYNIPPPQRASS